MSFKTKALGLVAATALSLSIVTGAMAADGGTKVNLTDGNPCAVSATSGTIDFGSAKWNGTNYGSLSGAIGSISVSVSNTEYAGPACKVTVTANDLTSGSKTIDNSKVSLGSGGVYTSTKSGGAYPDVTVTATLDLTNVNVPPALYTGTINVSAADAS